MTLKNGILSVVRNFNTVGAVYQAATITINSNLPTVIKKPITKHLKLFQSSVTSNKSGLLKTLANENQKPLVVMFEWLLAKPQHIKKYSDIYIGLGCNVLTVSMNPLQFLWPKTGAHVIADELLDYLKNTSTSQPLILHGFSVGAYLWGECLVRMSSDLVGYSPLIKRIKGQIWDSAPDVNELHKGLPAAVAPNSALLRQVVEIYFSFHMKRFYDAATKHYLNSSQHLHATPVRAPTLIFVCRNDPIASYESNRNVQASWDSLGIKTYFKCWDKSKHVSHIIYHKDEYVTTLFNFLSTLEFSSEDVPVKREKINAKL